VLSAHLPAPLVQNNPSSDLWVAGTVPNAKNTGASASIQYAVGAAEGARVFFSPSPNIVLTLYKGPVQTADLTLLGYTVKDQAFSTCSLYFLRVLY
jgi:hypothetical protein